MTKKKSLTIVFICYFFALLCSTLFILVFQNDNMILTLLYADIIATIIIYLASYIFKNSSIYDPYWSVIPPFLLIYWALQIPDLNYFNFYLLLFSVLFWAIRLTFNWIRGWKGLNQEDWRYIDLKNKSGKFYPLVNFLGIHFFPTVIVFVCCIPFKYAIESTETSLFIYIGFIISFIGVMYEIISDQQLFHFKKNNPGKIIESGLWKYSRHPNYYGEILFWWGIFLYGVNSENYILLILWPISMTVMFLYVSIPWIEEKILLTRPDYKNYQKNVNILVPEITLAKKYFRMLK